MTEVNKGASDGLETPAQLVAPVVVHEHHIVLKSCLTPVYVNKYISNL
jgi:hypothetical protein